MSKSYYAGRANLACTIFVPYDCSNNCPFCTSKWMYSKLDKNLDSILEHIKYINNCPVISEFVITGGEPIANLKILKTIIDKCEKKVFINTTLPLQDNILEVIDYINNEPKIKGINISRHMNFKFKDVADKNLISKITKPIRINSVISDKSKILSFIDEWKDYGMVNLRADYRKITPTTLKCIDEIDNLLLENYYYKGNTSCLVCNSEFFGDSEYTFCYHRGLENSSVVFETKVYVNDIIINPDGLISLDWNRKKDLEFEQAIKTNKIK